jgi:ATP-dependent RNA helicase DeaD/ATP-dependent RNA helicase RhlE
LTKTTFAELGISSAVCVALAKNGIHEPFDVQSLVIREAIEGSDLLVRSPTGSGKTLAFGLPVIERLKTLPRARVPRALVLAPTRELAVQITTELTAPAQAAGLKIACCYGGVPLPRQAAQAARADLVVATPGRLNDLIDRRLVKMTGIEILVLDEADRMLDMGFAPQVDRIVQTMPAERQTLLLSATLEGQVAELAQRLTRDAVQLRLGSEPVVVGVEHRFAVTVGDARLAMLVDELTTEPGLVLVFTRTKHGADRLATRLGRHGMDAVAMHGDLSQSARERALGRIRKGHSRVLVATDVAARGIDLDDVALVVNYDPPNDQSDYTHRVGRTARAGRSGQALTMLEPSDAPKISRMAVSLGLEAEWAATGLPVGQAKVVYASKRRNGQFSRRPASTGSATAKSHTSDRGRVKRGSRPN